MKLRSIKLKPTEWSKKLRKNKIFRKVIPRRRIFIPLYLAEKINVVFVCGAGIRSGQDAGFFLKLLRKKRIESYFSVSNCGMYHYRKEAEKGINSGIIRKADFVIFVHSGEKEEWVEKALEEGKATHFTMMGTGDRGSTGRKNIINLLIKEILPKYFKSEEV